MDAMTEQELIARAAAGDKQAYGTIVERCQSLVCAVTYSGCGDFAQSEDLAQETFLAAWGSLNRLEDPGRLRAWLCGIARNVTASFLRKRRRSGRGRAVSIDRRSEPAADSSGPGEDAIGREEAELVRKSLESVPENYREALVLFYREDRSVSGVAEALGISPETARQRLSRGRAMLRDRVTAVVERTLGGTRPGKALTIGVLAALPALAPSAAAATAATAAIKGAPVVKSAATLSVAGALLGPLVGLLGAYVGARAAIDSARSVRERRFLVRLSRLTFGATLVFVIALLALIFLYEPFRDNPALYGAGIAGLIVIHVGLIAVLTIWGNRRARKINEEETIGRARPTGTGSVQPSELGSVQPGDSPGREYRSGLTLLGLPLVHVALGGMREGQYRRGVARGWIAVGDISCGVILSVGGIGAGGIVIAGLGAGVLSLAGLSLGVFAVGGCAFGWIALGGAALAWQAAVGGLAIAVDYAVGGLAIAEEMNSDAARAYFDGNPLVRFARNAIEHSRWAMLLVLLPLFTVWRRRSRALSNPDSAGSQGAGERSAPDDLDRDRGQDAE